MAVSTVRRRRGGCGARTCRTVPYVVVVSIGLAKRCGTRGGGRSLRRRRFRPALLLQVGRERRRSLPCACGSLDRVTYTLAAAGQGRDPLGRYAHYVGNAHAQRSGTMEAHHPSIHEPWAVCSRHPRVVRGSGKKKRRSSLGILLSALYRMYYCTVPVRTDIHAHHILYSTKDACRDVALRRASWCVWVPAALARLRYGAALACPKPPCPKPPCPTLHHASRPLSNTYS